MPRRVEGGRGTYHGRRSKRRLNRIDALAEAVAEGATIKAASKSLGIPYSTGKRLFASICAGLGEQGV